MCSRVCFHWLTEEVRSHQAPGLNLCQDPGLASQSLCGSRTSQGTGGLTMKWTRQAEVFKAGGEIKDLQGHPHRGPVFPLRIGSHGQKCFHVTRTVSKPGVHFQVLWNAKFALKSFDHPIGEASRKICAGTAEALVCYSAEWGHGADLARGIRTKSETMWTGDPWPPTSAVTQLCDLRGK